MNISLWILRRRNSWLSLILLALASCSAYQPILGEIAMEEMPAEGMVTPSAMAATLVASEPAAQAVPDRETEVDYTIADRTDDVDGLQIHFFYALPSDGRDDLLDVNGTISLSAAAMNDWFQRKTDHLLRYDTYQRELDISFLHLGADADTISALGTDILVYLEHEIKTRGFESKNKLFVVYYDGFFVTPEGYCGLASYPPEGAGQTAVLLLRGYNPTLDLVCPRQFTKSADYTGYFELTILHEVLHLLGIVPACAPNNNGGHVSDNPQDLMYGEYDGSYSPLYMILDFHNDDYYGHGDLQCPDLARSAFLDPLPDGAESPPGWDVSSRYLPPNPLEQE